jgi:hypothetical protein
LAVLAWDAARLAHWLTHELAKHAARLVGAEWTDDDDDDAGDAGSSGGGPAGLLVRRALASAAAPLEALAASCWERVAAGVAGVCCLELAAVRGVTAVYRMTNKPPPHSASPFVPGLLRPLQEFDAAWGQRYAEGPALALKSGSSEAAGGLGGGWKRCALALVVARYQAVVLEVLGQVRAMDEALKKRKKAKGTGGDHANTEKLSDAEKIGLQLWLDSERFGEALAGHGLPPLESLSFVELQAELKPFAKFRGAAS